MSEPAEDDDFFWKVAHRFRPVHGVMLFSFVALFMCCGSCGLLRSCNKQPEFLSDSEVLEILDDKIEVAADDDNERQKKKADDFTVEERILAESLTVGEWKNVTRKTQTTTADYLAFKKHPNDSGTDHFLRMIWYMNFIQRAASIPKVRAYSIESACVAADEEFPKFRQELQELDRKEKIKRGA